MAFFKKITFGPLLACALVAFFPAAAVSAPQPPRIRVALALNVPETVISVNGSYDIISYPEGEKLFHGSGLKATRISVTGNTINVGANGFPVPAIKISPRKKGAITVNKRPYRGDIVLARRPSGSLDVINILDLESYVKGVLPQEISPRWPIDAIKAQAVAARTYALEQKEAAKARAYDVNADTSSQVYGGFASERNKSNRAVNFTYGEVLFYKGKVFPAYFHATCAGMTEPAAELWKVDMEPLSGGRVCSYCGESPHFYWTYGSDLKAVQKKIGKAYSLKKGLADIRVAERGISGRIRKLELKDEEEKSQFLSGKDFRQFLGADVIRSTNFTINIEGQKVVFSGKGWGHGVGLCQWGALGMSKKGHSYSEILDFYYPGSQVRKVY